MKKIYSGIICMVMAASFVVAPVKVSAQTTTTAQNEQLIQLLMQMLKDLQSKSSATAKSSTNITPAVIDEDKKSNSPSLTITNVTTLNVDREIVVSFAYLPVDSQIWLINAKTNKPYEAQSTMISGGGSGSTVIPIPADVRAGMYRLRVSDYNDQSDIFAQSKKFKISKTRANTKEIERKERENLSIHSISLSLPAGIGHTSAEGYPVPDQKVEVEIKNNEYGAISLSGEKINYSAYLYEVDDSGSDIKTTAKVTGEVLVPYANGYSSFEFFIEGGLPFDGNDFERDFRIKVEIDTDNDVKESNERDNKMWSDTWMVDYYKG